MEPYDEQVLYENAIKLWGADFQKQMMVEECAELIKALMKEKRKINGSTKEQVISELADVSIMLEQMAILYGRDAIEAEKQKKLERLRVMIGVE